MADVKTHNRILATELGEAVCAIPKECFRNAVMALFFYQGEEKPTYIEGILSIWNGMMLIDHGWLEIGACIVDPTLDDCPAVDYHPVFRYTLKEVERHVKRDRYLPYYMQKRDGHRRMGLAHRKLFWDSLSPEAKEFYSDQLKLKEEA